MDSVPNLSLDAALDMEYLKSEENVQKYLDLLCCNEMSSIEKVIRDD